MMIGLGRALSTSSYMKVDQWRVSRPCAFCQRQLMAEGSKGEVGLRASRPQDDWCLDCDARLARNLHACPCCAEPVGSEALAHVPCARCLASPPAFQQVFAPLRYEGLLAGLFQRYKDHHQRRAGRLLGLLMQRELTSHCRDWVSSRPQSVVIMVPADRQRCRQRGHDALAELCKSLRPAFEGCREMKAILNATQVTQDQRMRGRRGRLKAQRGRYEIRSPLPASVLLLDDVMTSGATLDSLALACRRAGAQEVVAAVLARTPLGSQ